MLSSDGAAITVEKSQGLFSCSIFRKVCEDLRIRTEAELTFAADDLSHSKNLSKNSGTSEPATSPVVQQFPRHRNFRGNDSEKRGIRAGKFQGSTAGIGEVTFSDVTAAESGRGCGLGRGGHRTGDMDASSPGTPGIKRNSTEQKSPLKLKMYSISTNTHIAN
jgi:hypothetical protein